MIGTYYYPEQWPTDQWARDFARIKQMGLQHVHMGEFAWTHMQPAENRFTFTWLDRAVELAKAAALKIILCTPTAAPPVWVSQTYPEVLPVRANGRRVTHGSRAQRCVNSKQFKRLAGTITTRMAERYGRDPRIIGWQIDNELGHYDHAPCYCSACRVQFQYYLQGRYGTIEKLNQNWAGDFWSQRYDNFEQIEPPNPESLVYLPNEHAQLDFLTFYSTSMARFIERQARIIRNHLHHNAWVTHNFVAADPFVYPRHVNPSTLDFFSITAYPVSGHYQGESPSEQFRIGDPMEVARHCDFARGHNGRWGLMEIQPGQVNWGPYNCRPYPGAVRLWLWTAIAHGAELLDTYRFRQPLAGSEQYHSGLLTLDGNTPSPGGAAFQQVAAEVEQLETYLSPPDAVAMPRAAIYLHWPSLKALELHPQSRAFDPLQCWMRFYGGLKAHGFKVDIIDQKSDLTPYDLVCAVTFDLVPDALLVQWEHYLKAGGHLLVGPRTATRLPNGHFPPIPYGQRLARLLKAEVEGYDVLPNEQNGHIELLPERKSVTWHRWAEQWRPDASSTIMARYADQFYHGSCAAFQIELGKGAATLVGFDSDTGVAEVLPRVLTRLRQNCIPLPSRCLYHTRGRLGIFLNYSDTTQKVPPDLLNIHPTHLLIGRETAHPADVVVWRYE